MENFIAKIKDLYDDFRTRNVKSNIIMLLIIIIILLLIYYFFILSPWFGRSKFAKEMIQRSDENSPFHLQRIMLFNSASALHDDNDKTLSNLNICQYSDLSIYIDNKSSEDSVLTNENTVKELYIDNIDITTKLSKSRKSLNYKNPLNFGKFNDIEKAENDRIDFKIIHTNEENNNNTYDEPTFFTDCSNPITLGYLNKNIIKNYSVKKNEATVSFNANILKEANLELKDLNCTLNFDINIVNNLNHKYSFNMSLDINLDDDIFTHGYSYLGRNFTGPEYRFLRN